MSFSACFDEKIFTGFRQVWEHWHQKQIIKTWISNYMPQYSVGCSYTYMIACRMYRICAIVKCNCLRFVLLGCVVVNHSTHPCDLFTVYPKKYAHGFVVLCFVVVMQSFIMNSHEVFIHIHQGCFAGTGAIVRLPQCQWSKPDGYGKISQCITTTKHNKAKTVCIFLGIYCSFAIQGCFLGIAMMTSSNGSFSMCYWPFVRGIHRLQERWCLFDLRLNKLLTKQ